MKKSRKRRTTRILVTVIAVLVLVIVLVCIILLYRNMKKLKAVSIVPNFSEEELEPDTDYSFTVKTQPFNADIKSLEYIVSDSSSQFTASEEPHKAILHTGNAGSITIYVQLGKIESEKMSFMVVDHSVQEVVTDNFDDIEKPSEVPADTEVTEEPEKETVKIVTVTGDNVRMRAEPNTDCDIVKTCNKGETYTFIEVTGDWTGVDNDGKESYIKSEFVEVEEKVQESENREQDSLGNDTGNEDGNGKTETTTKIGEGMVEVECQDGKALFTQAEYDYFVATWAYTGMADEMMTHHSAAELHNLYNVTH